MIGTSLFMVGMIRRTFLSMLVAGMRMPTALATTCGGGAMKRGLLQTTAVADSPSNVRMFTTKVASASRKVVSVFSRDDLQRIAREPNAEILEETRIMEEASLREVEEFALKKLEECVKQCRYTAAAARMDHYHDFILSESAATFSFEQEGLVNKRLEMLREVLTTELPLRLPGVDFTVLDHTEVCFNTSDRPRGFRVELSWQETSSN